VEHQGSSWASDTHSVTQKLQFIDVTVWVLIEGRILTARVLIEAGVQALWTWLEAMDMAGSHVMQATFDL